MASGNWGFAARSAAFSATVFFGLGIYLPFFPPWLEGRGFSDAEIAIIIATPLFVRLVLTPLLVGVADRLPGLRAAAALYALIATLSVALLIIVPGFWPILILSAIAVILWNTLMPFSEAVILVGARDHGIDYGRVRLWGSVGFIAANFIAAAVVARGSGDAVLVLLAIAFFAGSVVGLALPGVGVAGPQPAGFRQAFTDPTLRRAILAGSLLLGGHGAYYAFGSIYWQSLGFSQTLIGGLWAFGVVAEVALFWGAKLLPGWGARRFFIAACIGALIRWLAFPFATSPIAALALQSLHAVSFGLAHLGVIMAIAAVATRGHTARLQAAHQFVGGLVLAISTAAAGPLFKLSPDVAFWAMAALALPALAFAYGLRRGLQPQSAAGGGSTRAPE